MFRKITVVISLFVLTGCSLGQALQVVFNTNEKYEACITDQIQIYSASYDTSELTVEKVTKFVVSECRGQEEAYVVAMTGLAMTITGSMVSPEKFLEDEEATLRNDRHDLAASLVEQSL